MTCVTDKYLESGGYVVCTFWAGAHFTKGSVYYSDGLSLTSNYPNVTVNFWAVTRHNFRRAYKNEIKGK